MAEPHTTKMKRANNQGPTLKSWSVHGSRERYLITGYFSWSGLVDLGTLPRAVMFFLWYVNATNKKRDAELYLLRLGICYLHPLLSRGRHLCNKISVFIPVDQD